jgi:sensor histidine kinase YesM
VLITIIFENMIPFSKAQWIVWIFMLLLLFGLFLQSNALLESAYSAVTTALFYMVIIYGNALWLIPYVYERNRKLLYVLLVIVFLTILTYIRIQSQMLLYTKYLTTEASPTSKQFSFYVSYFLSTALIYIFSLAFYLSRNYFLLRKRTAEAELKLLKAQVQPHFLFNTLNNIYFVAQRESPDTAALLERLSNIMRYFVDEGTKDVIQLTTEINFIHDYIHLESMRMRHPLQVKFEMNGDTENLLIPPMLLIPLIENVFKHGIDKRQDDNYLTASVNISKDTIDVMIANRIYGSSVKGGTGIPNLSSRLRLLYGNRYIFETTQRDGSFYAHLNIPV